MTIFSHTFFVLFWQVKAGQIGRPPTLPPGIEDKLVEAIKKAAAMGFGLSMNNFWQKLEKL